MAGRPFRAACAQLTSTPDLAANLAAIDRLAREAADGGADLVAFPENAPLLAPGKAMAEAAVPEEEHPARAAAAEAARACGLWVLLGSLAVRTGDPDGRLANRSLLFDPKGAVRARYDKIHMFDADPASGERYRESERYRPGGGAVLAETPWGLLGMTVCYDLRFPELYRDLARAGAWALSIPSAFTVPTGEAHWETLLRARAIEAGAYVLAPAQCGTHYGTRRTWGHTLVVDPWGAVVARAGGEPGLVFADLDPERADEARKRVPSLSHDRPWEPPRAA